MAVDDSFDETTLNVLLADGVDAPTAYAASYVSPESQSGDSFSERVASGRATFDAGLVIGLAIGILWLLWQ